MLSNYQVSTIIEHFYGKSMSSSMNSRYPKNKQVRENLALLISTWEQTDDFIKYMRHYNGRDSTKVETFSDDVIKILNSDGTIKTRGRHHACTFFDEAGGGFMYISPCVFCA